MSEERLRAFIALPLPQKVKAQLAEVQAELRRSLPAGALRYTRPEQFHLTLSFLGNIEPWQAEAVGELLQRLGSTVPAFRLETAGLGAFPNPRRPSVLWLGVAGDSSALYALQNRLETGLRNLDLRGEQGNFRAHLTLARIKGLSPALRRGVAELLGRDLVSEPVGWTADRVELIRSRLSPEGARYSVLMEVKLTGAEAQGERRG